MAKLPIKLLSIIAIFAIIACSPNHQLKHHELLVPPFIQDNHPELYNIFKTNQKKPEKS